MARYLQVQPYISSQTLLPYYGGYRVLLSVTTAVDMDAEVFLYRRDPPTFNRPVAGNTFLTVCSPVDMTEYPIGDPDTELRYPYFRASAVELDFRSLEQAQKFLSDATAAICGLITNLDRLDALTALTPFSCGVPPDSEVPDDSETSEDSEIP